METTTAQTRRKTPICIMKLFHIYSGEANPHNSGNYKFRVVAETHIPLWFY